MKVLLLNTSEKTGGAAIACNRLMYALNKNGVEANMLVRDKQTDDPHVKTVNTSLFKVLLNKLRFIWERGVIYMCNSFSKNNLFRISISNTGNNIINNLLVKEADIIHLHWVNQGFLSLHDIRLLSKLDKPLVWTMHDMWPCTGICHHSRECEKYQSMCNQCFYVKKSCVDMASIVFHKKIKLLKDCPFHFVTCSAWLKERASQSHLFNYHQVVNIPNPINTQKFCSLKRNDARQALNINSSKKLILFGSAKITDERKGIAFFIEACHLMTDAHPELVNEIEVVIFGQNSDILSAQLAFHSYSMNYLKNDTDIINMYNAVDLYVTPSLDENLPNTIMEAMSCGIPCVGFKTGGIPEMINHLQNGYVAEYMNAEDLAKGILWVLQEANYQQLSANAVAKVKKCYSEEVVAKQYIGLYQSLL